MKKIINYFKLIHMLNKSTMHLGWFKILQSIMNFVIQVHEDGKPRLTKIATIDMSEDDPVKHIDIVSLWAGIGDSNPIERSREIKNQNTELKRLLTIARMHLDIPDHKNLVRDITLVLDTFE